jgi:hypothetical protein
MEVAVTRYVYDDDPFDFVAFENGPELILRKDLDPLDQPRGAALDLALEAIELFRPALEPSCLRLYLATREPPEGFYGDFASPSLWRLCAPALPGSNAAFPIADNIVEEQVAAASAAALHEWTRRALAQPCPAGLWNTMHDLSYEVFAVRMTSGAEKITLSSREGLVDRHGMGGLFPARVPASLDTLAEFDIVNDHDGVELSFVAGCSGWLDPSTVPGQTLLSCVRSARENGWSVVVVSRDWPEPWHSMLETAP